MSFGSINFFKILISAFVVQFLLTCSASAQDIEKIAKSDVLKASGGISLNQIFYHANGKVSSRNPYTYLLNGNINLEVLGFINAPFTFMYSNLGNRYTQPNFNQTAIHPNYKWITTHFGTIACTYSPYTVNGHLFNGAAVDLTPGKFSFSGFYGKLQKAVSIEHAVVNTNAIPIYKRMGGGAKMGYKSEKLGTLGLVLFSAKDDINSLPSINSPEVTTPKQNWNGCFQIQKNLFNRLNVNADVSYSMLNEDLFTKSENTALPSFLRFNGTNSATAIYRAIKTGISYNIGKNSINAGYEKIDPYYKTLGAYYFNNDLENITAGFSTQTLKQKLNIAANAGLQHDNLNKTKLSTMSRFVGNLNLNFRPNNKVNTNFNYSNFLSYTNIRPFTDYQNQLNPYLAWDTLNFRQISQNITSNVSLVLHADSLTSSNLSGSLTYQTAADKQGTSNNGNAFYNANMGYALSRIKSGETIVISLNAGQTSIGQFKLINICPVVSVSKPFLNKKLRPGASISYTNSYFNHAYAGGILNLRGMLNYTHQKVHNFNFTFLLLNRKDNPANSIYTHNLRFTETTFSLVYSVNMAFFDVGKRK